MTHIQHIEDLVLTEKNGGNKCIHYLNLVKDSLADIKIKWDGAPAVVAGIHPDTQKFFVGTKAVFSKTNPKICYTNEDIEHFYSKVPDLKHKLKVCLEYLPQLEYDGIFCGDFLFSSKDIDRDLVTSKYTPNTITYESRIYSHQELGFAVHTRYESLNNQNCKPSDIDVTHFERVPEIFLVDGIINPNIPNILGLETNIYLAENLLKAINKDFLDEVGSNSKLSRQLYKFIVYWTNNGNTFKDGIHVYDKFLTDLIMTDRENPISQPHAIKRRKDWIKYIQDNRENLIVLFLYYYAVAQSKKMICNALMRNQNHKTYIDNEHSTHEGFIVEAHVKIVNREDFTYKNYLKNTERKSNHGR